MAAQNVPAFVPVPVLANYEENMKLRTWLLILEHHLAHEEVPVEDWASHLIAWLDDEVYVILDKYLLEEEQKDYAVVKGWMVWRFGDGSDSFDGEEFQLVENEFYFQIRFFERRQRNHECVTDFANALMGLLPLAYPNLSEAEGMAIVIDHFINGLNNGSQLKDMDRAQFPQNMDAILVIAVQHERDAVSAEDVANFVAAFCARTRSDDETYNDFFKDIKLLCAGAYPTDKRRERWPRIKLKLSGAVVCG